MVHKYTYTSSVKASHYNYTKILEQEMTILHVLREPAIETASHAESNDECMPVSKPENTWLIGHNNDIDNKRLPLLSPTQLSVSIGKLNETIKLTDDGVCPQSWLPSS